MTGEIGHSIQDAKPLSQCEVVVRDITDCVLYAEKLVEEMEATFSVVLTGKGAGPEVCVSEASALTPLFSELDRQRNRLQRALEGMQSIINRSAL